MRLIKDGFIVCKNCGQVHEYLTADEYIDFYENRHRIKRKSVYHRTYHILNVINDIAHDNNIIQVGYYNREKILRIFRLIDQVIPQVNNFRRRRLIRVNFIIKRLFDILGVEYKIIPITQSKNTLRYYENWWEVGKGPYESLIEGPWEEFVLRVNLHGVLSRLKRPPFCFYRQRTFIQFLLDGRETF